LLVAVLAATSGVVLGAWYLLWLIERILFGKLQQPEVHGPPPRDLRFREVAALAPLAVLVFWIGICPGFFLKPMQRTLQPITAAAERRLPGHRAHSKAALSWSQAPPRPATKPIDDHADEEQALAQ
jgi:NADH-quinone oxidoreductase subunit M